MTAGVFQNSAEPYRTLGNLSTSSSSGFDGSPVTKWPPPSTPHPPPHSMLCKSSTGRARLSPNRAAWPQVKWNSKLITQWRWQGQCCLVNLVKLMRAGELLRAPGVRWGWGGSGVLPLLAFAVTPICALPAEAKSGMLMGKTSPLSRPGLCNLRTYKTTLMRWKQGQEQPGLNLGTTQV